MTNNDNEYIIDNEENYKRIEKAYKGDLMRNYSYKNELKKLLTPEIVALLTKIHEYKGEQNNFLGATKDTLTHLVEIAKIQSTESSNKIEGIYTSSERLTKILKDKTRPSNRSEQEIAGYRDVLALIHENHEHIKATPNMILQLHKMLYKYGGYDGGVYKFNENVTSEEDEKGNKRIRFSPVPTWETPLAMDELCRAFDEAMADPEIDPLLIIPMFILDFLCIHPFGDGNGRMSRLLTLLLLYRSGYVVGKYISIEKAIEQTKTTYYESLEDSSYGWHENANDYGHFVRYMLGIVLGAYREFKDRVQTVVESGSSKTERVRDVIKNTIGKITKAEILKECPDISDVTVQRTLNYLLKNGEITKIGGGRYTSYIWNGD